MRRTLRQWLRGILCAFRTHRLKFDTYPRFGVCVDCGKRVK